MLDFGFFFTFRHRTWTNENETSDDKLTNNNSPHVCITVYIYETKVPIRQFSGVHFLFSQVSCLCSVISSFCLLAIVIIVEIRRVLFNIQLNFYCFKSPVVNLFNLRSLFW